MGRLLTFDDHKWDYGRNDQSERSRCSECRQSTAWWVGIEKIGDRGDLIHEINQASYAHRHMLTMIDWAPHMYTAVPKMGLSQ